MSTSSTLPLYKQVSRSLLAKIRSGELSVGGKTLGERRLAKAMGISRGTASLALRELARSGYLERNVGSGTYVSSEKTYHLLHLTIVSTIQEISLKYQSYSNWLTMSGLYRGMQSACAEWDAQLSFRCSPQTLSKTEAFRLANELSLDNDALVITNDVPENLQNALANTGVLLFSSDEIASPKARIVTYDRQAICHDAAAYLLSKGYRTCGILLNSLDSNNTILKIKGFTAKTKFGQLDLLPQWIIELPNDNNYAVLSTAMAEKLPKKTAGFPDVFLTITPAYSLEFRKLAGLRGWCLPQDVALLGYGNDDNESFSPLPLTYIRIPYAEIGSEIIRLVNHIVRQHQELPASLLPSKLVLGQTT
ncbi:MAG: substrate-binding domain-containing protein [Lentisphaeria bacterium]